jgi:hypothetical protein
MLLEAIQRVNDDWGSIHMHKLFGDVLPHSITGSTGDN